VRFGKRAVVGAVRVFGPYSGLRFLIDKQDVETGFAGFFRMYRISILFILKNLENPVIFARK
jgi:hypothetical protein